MISQALQKIKQKNDFTIDYLTDQLYDYWVFREVKADGHLIISNAFAKYLGYSTTTFKHTDEFFDLDSLSKVDESQSNLNGNFTLKIKNSDAHLFEFEAVTISFEDNKETYALYLIKDKSIRTNETNAREEELIHYKNLLERTNEVARIGTWEVDLIKNKVSWSKITREIHEISEEYEPDLETGINFYKPGEDREKITEIFGRAASEGKKFDAELRIITAKGNERWIRTIGIPEFKANVLVRVYGVFQDIHDKKQQEEAIYKSYEQTKLFIDQAPSSIAMFDREIRYIAASKNWYHDYKITDANIIGKSHYEIFPEIGDKWKKIHQECLNGAVNKNDEAEFKRPDGKSQWIKWDVRPWYNLKNEIGGIVMFTSDITPLKNAQNEAEMLLKLMTNQNERLINFSHIVSHNLRSHTANLNALTRLIKSSDDNIGENKYFEMLETATENLSETIAHLHEVASMNTNSDEEMERLNLTSYINKAIEIVQPELIKKEGEIIVNFEKEIFIYAIPAYLESILLNLITNTIKYASPSRKLRVIIDAKEDLDKTIISVADNGLGIDMKKHKHKIFGMYKVFHDHEDSRGIGLFITKSQVEAMHGRIYLKSEVDKGSTFFVELQRQEFKKKFVQ